MNKYTDKAKTYIKVYPRDQKNPSPMRYYEDIETLIADLALFLGDYDENTRDCITKMYDLSREYGVSTVKVYSGLFIDITTSY